MTRSNPLGRQCWCYLLVDPCALSSPGVVDVLVEACRGTGSTFPRSLWLAPGSWLLRQGMAAANMGENTVTGCGRWPRTAWWPSFPAWSGLEGARKSARSHNARPFLSHKTMGNCRYYVSNRAHGRDNQGGRSHLSNTGLVGIGSRYIPPTHMPSPPSIRQR